MPKATERASSQFFPPLKYFLSEEQGKTLIIA
jgi:hypothetical protein